MKYTTEELIEGLKKLSGLDFEEAETAERNAGNMTPFLNLSPKFQMRLAAKALGVNVHDLKALPIQHYNQLAAATSIFLFSNSDNTTPSPKSEM